MKIFFYTLGCKVNQYETQEMIELFENNGHDLVRTPAEADVIVVNSCTVTAESVRKTRQAIRRFKKQNENSIVILTGCASQAEPHIVNDLPEVDILAGNKTNSKLVSALEEFLKTKSYTNIYNEHQTGDKLNSPGITRFDGHTRAFLKIQDGCDRFCSYCLIPTARGRSRSKPLEDIDKELKALSESGYKEIVFVGINLSDYGKNTPHSLPDALMLAEKYDSIKRVRLGSLEPDHITDEMIERLSEISKLCPQFHISVQSGCDNVLKKMNRHYTAQYYIHLAEKLRETFSDATITTDVLVGFPTETEDDFNETLEFCKMIAFEKAHIFPYSVRENTVAARMPQLTSAIKDNRAARLSQAMEEIRKEYLLKQTGKIVNVLFEIHKNGYSEGYTENYTPVKVYGDCNLQGKILRVLLKNVENDFCVGEII